MQIETAENINAALLELKSRMITLRPSFTSNEMNIATRPRESPRGRLFSNNEHNLKSCTIRRSCNLLAYGKRITV